MTSDEEKMFKGVATSLEHLTKHLHESFPDLSQGNISKEQLLQRLTAFVNEHTGKSTLGYPFILNCSTDNKDNFTIVIEPDTDLIDFTNHRILEQVLDPEIKLKTSMSFYPLEFEDDSSKLIEKNIIIQKISFDEDGYRQFQLQLIPIGETTMDLATYIRTYNTTFLGGGRQSGKTTSIIEQADENSLVVIPRNSKLLFMDVYSHITEKMKKDVKLRLNQVLPIDEFLKIEPKENIHRIFVDDASYVFDHYRRNDFYKKVAELFSNRAHIFMVG